MASRSWPISSTDRPRPASGNPDRIRAKSLRRSLKSPLTEDKDEADKILSAQADFGVHAVLRSHSGDRAEARQRHGQQVVEIGEDEVTEQIMRIAESARTYEVKKGKAADGDRVKMAYLGKVDGEAFEGGKDDDAELVIGSNRFIPGFRSAARRRQGRRRRSST